MRWGGEERVRLFGKQVGPRALTAVSMVAATAVGVGFLVLVSRQSQEPQSVAQEKAPVPSVERRDLSVERGDTLMKLVTSAGISRVDAQSAIDAMRGAYDPRRLKPGQVVSVSYRRDDANPAGHILHSVELRDGAMPLAAVARDAADGFATQPSRAAPAPSAPRQAVPPPVPKPEAKATTKPAERVASAAPGPKDPMKRRVTIRSGDTLISILKSLGVSHGEAVEAAQSAAKVFDPRDLRIGDALDITLEKAAKQRGELRVLAIHLDSSVGRDVTIVRKPGEQERAKPRKASEPSAAREVDVRVSGSLASSLDRAGVPRPVAEELVKIARYDPGFPEKPRDGARVAVVYERREPNGFALRYAALTENGKTHRLYRYDVSPGKPAFVNAKGKGIAVVQLSQPVERVRVTSPWGWRIHPVLGGRRFHRGIDFGAPKGSPILATADGVVDLAGWRGNYGNYMLVNHGLGVATAYAHLDRFAEGVHAGTQVRRGQVIGYVGDTGLATGSHLYYEVKINGRQVDPARSEFAVPVHVAGVNLRQLEARLRSAG